MLTSVVVRLDGLMGVIDALDRAGYDVWAPAIRDGVLVTRRFQDGDELPVGYVSDQSPGAYELVPTSDRSRFGWAVGPQPWKPLLHPASVTTMTMTQPDSASTVAVAVASRQRKPLALFGMRPCDIAGVDKLDRVLLERPSSGEPTYRARRSDAFFVVVNCGVPASTCFCSSVDTGPHVDGRTTTHDLEVTELVGETATDEPEYVIAAISGSGAEILERVAGRVESAAVSDVHLDRVTTSRTIAEADMQRQLPAERVAPALTGSHDSPRWEDIAETCLACGNCTAVCPTCFCTTINDVGDLAGTRVERHRDWESCFSLEFSRLGNSPVRSSVAARYRQWMTHKLGTWHDQFGESGCVGCGRCTTWCPVGIDFVHVAQGFVDDAEGVQP
jgi:sulfhydrogenase subunit beta (sulfur reductase)